MSRQRVSTCVKDSTTIPTCPAVPFPWLVFCMTVWWSTKMVSTMDGGWWVIYERFHRYPCHLVANGQGYHHVLSVGIRTRARRSQKDGHEGHDHSCWLAGHDLLVEAIHLVVLEVAQGHRDSYDRQVEGKVLVMVVVVKREKRRNNSCQLLTIFDTGGSPMGYSSGFLHSLVSL